MLLTKGKVAVFVLVLAVVGGGAALPGQPTQDASQPETKSLEAPARVSETAGDRLLFLEGSTRFLLGDYRAADRAFCRLAEDKPSSPFAAQAIELAILSKQLGDSTAAERERKGAEARRIIKKALSNVRERADGSGRQLIDMTMQQAEKDFKTGEFYRHIGHPGTARFYYELVQQRYSATKYAKLAAERLQLLKPKKAKPKQAKLAAGDKPPTLIGQIFIVGNTKTESGIILDNVQLYPGAVLKYPDLQQAERNLRKLGIFEDDPVKGIHPTVLVMDPNGDSPYKDILIQVQEKK